MNLFRLLLEKKCLCMLIIFMVNIEKCILCEVCLIIGFGKTSICKK